MPLWLILIVIGIVLVVAARYWIGDPQFSRWAYGGGVACIIIGVLFLVAGLLGLANPTARAEALSPMALGGGLMLGTLDTLHAAPSDPIAPKPWYQSKTLIVSIGSLIALFVTQLLQNAGALHLDAQTVIWITMGLTTFLAALRLVTNTAIEGTPAAAKVETAKADIALHAMVMNDAAPPPPAQPSIEDIGRLLAQVKKERDDRNALLDKAAAMASAPPATMPPAPSTLSAVMPPPVTAP